MLEGAKVEKKSSSHQEYNTPKWAAIMTDVPLNPCPIIIKDGLNFDLAPSGTKELVDLEVTVSLMSFGEN